MLCANGERYEADLVIDGRGLKGVEFGPVAFQKFFGLFIKTTEKHPFTRPLLMDATVSQLDGYRFVYVLPWSETELLVEDTRYSDDALIDQAAMTAEIEKYLRLHYSGSYDVLSDEAGALPIPLYGARRPVLDTAVVQSGVRAGLFHATTGYSLPKAVGFANWLSRSCHLAASDLAQAAHAHAHAEWRRGGFCRRLNSMFFKAAKPQNRRHVMAEFYRRDPALIQRFYGDDLSLGDRLRLLSGRPPVPLIDGARAFFLKSSTRAGSL